MVFFLNFILSVFYFYGIGQLYRDRSISLKLAVVLFFPVIGIWLMVSGGQKDVGTDYSAYIEIFKGIDLDRYFAKGEYLFYYLVVGLNRLGLSGQILFYVFYGLNFWFLILIGRRIQVRSLFIFILLYFTVSNLFNNQLNGLRQTTAIYIGTYATILLLEHQRFRFLVWVLVATLIHFSAILFVVFYVFHLLRKFSFRKYKLWLLGSFIAGLCFRIEWLNYFIGDYLPVSYMAYLQGNDIEQKGLLVKLSKYIFIPLYWLSLKLIREKRITGFSLMLYNIGFFSFCFRLILINVSIVSRITDLYILLSVFPLFYYLEDLYLRRKPYSFLFWCGSLVVFYFLKTVVFPSAEYLYQSIYF